LTYGKIRRKEQGMTKRQKLSAGTDNRPMEKGKPGERKAGESGQEDCRCQEVSKKTVPELLKIMVSDLTFWKKGNK
jgi:hypothetical protein